MHISFDSFDENEQKICRRRRTMNEVVCKSGIFISGATADRRCDANVRQARCLLEEGGREAAAARAAGDTRARSSASAAGWRAASLPNAKIPTATSE